MSRPGRKRNDEEPPNPFASDAREVRNQRHSRRPSLTTSQIGIHKKENPNAPQRRSMSGPSEGRKEIPPTPPNSQRTEPQPQSIGNHEWMWNFIIWEDAKPFNDNADFFSMNNSLFNKCNHGVDIKLNSQRRFENNSQEPIQEIRNRSEEGMFISECFRRVAKFIRPGPGNYKVMHKDRINRLLGRKKNRVSKKILKKETENITRYVNEKYTNHKGEVVDRVVFAQTKGTNATGNTPSINFVRRAKFLRGAVIDTDGASLEKLFFQKNNTLEYGKVNTNNGLLQNFFYNIYYWGVGDKKLLALIHPNYESSVYNGIKVQTSFAEISHQVRPLALVYGLAMPPFFRKVSDINAVPIEECLDQDSTLGQALEKELVDNMHGAIQVNQFLESYKGKYPISTTYAEHVYSSFYVSKNERVSTGIKRKELGGFCILKSDKERENLYKGNDFIQCYEIEKISDYEIKVERLKV